MHDQPVGTADLHQEVHNRQYQKIVVTDRTPQNYIDAIMPKIKACGWDIVNTTLNGGSITTRVANAGIEKKYRVRIIVSGLNVTDPKKTDSEVVRLYDRGLQTQT